MKNKIIHGLISYNAHRERNEVWINLDRAACSPDIPITRCSSNGARVTCKLCKRTNWWHFKEKRK